MDEFNNYNSDQGTSDNGYNTDFTQSNDYYNQYGNEPPQGKGKAIAALVLGIVALVLSCCCTYIVWIRWLHNRLRLYGLHKDTSKNQHT